MAVSKSLAQKLNARYGTPIPGESQTGLATAQTAKTPSIWDQAKAAPKQVVEAAVSSVQKAAPAVKKTVHTIAKNMPAAEAKAKADAKINKTASLKDQLRGLDFGAREALRKNAIPTKDGKFMLPSVDDPVLGQFEGLEFSMSEWAQNYSAASGGSGKATISAPTGTLKKVGGVSPIAEGAVNLLKIVGQNDLAESYDNALRDTDAIEDKALRSMGSSLQQKQWMEAESNRQAKTRMEERAKVEQDAGLDYLGKLRASRPTDDYANWDTSITPSSVFNDVLSSLPALQFAPLAVIGKQVDRLTGNTAAKSMNEFGKSIQRTGIEAVGNLGSAAEAFAGNDPYMNFIAKYGAKLSDNMKVARLKTPQLNQDKTVSQSFMGGGYMDPTWYASTAGAVVPHALASMAASITGGLLAGPAGAGAGAVSYGFSMERGSMYDQMLENGASLNDAREASLWYGVIAGTLDAIVPGEIGGRVVNATSKSLLAEAAKETTKESLLTAFNKVGYTTFKEASLEGGQKVAENITMRFYDTTQDIWENVVDSFVGGAIGGGVFAGVDAKATPGTTSAQSAAPLAEEEVTGASPVAEVMGITPAEAGKMSKQEIDTAIDELLDASRAQEASVALGTQLQMKFPENEVIKTLTKEAEESLEEMNQQAEMLMELHADTTSTEVLNLEGVKVTVGQMPDGTFSASSDLTMGSSSMLVPFSTKRAFPTKEDAIADVVDTMSAYVAKQVTTSGVQNTQEIENLTNTLAGAKEALVVAQTRQVDVQSVEGTKTTNKNMSKKTPSDYKTADEYIASYGDTVYHGTNAKFEVFDPTKINTVEDLGDYVGAGYYFTTSKEKAGKYAGQSVKKKGGEVNVMEAFLDMKNPLVIKNAQDAQALRDSFGGDEAYFSMEPTSIRDELERRGYDGLVDELYGQRAVFSPEQIKTKDQLRKIWEDAQGMSGGETVSLAEQAKQYTSSREFIDSVVNAYHGTDREFTVFSKDFIGDNQQTDWGDGLYFTDTKEVAESFAGDAGGSIVMPVYVDIKNPARNDVLDSPEIQDILADDMGFEDIGEVLLSKGYDGIEFTHSDGSREFVVYDTKQVKTEDQLRRIWQKANGKEAKEKESLYSRVSARMAGEYSEINPETYERIGIADEIDKAIKSMEKDKEQTFRDAMGITEIPEYERAAKNIVLTEKALDEGNFELAAQLIKSRSLRATELGQAIAMEKGSVTDNSAQKYMRELLAARMQELGDKYTSTIDKSALKKQTPVQRGQKVLKERVAKVKSEISTKKKLDIQSAQDFIKSLQCN